MVNSVPLFNNARLTQGLVAPVISVWIEFCSSTDLLGYPHSAASFLILIQNCSMLSNLSCFISDISTFLPWASCAGNSSRINLSMRRSILTFSRGVKMTSLRVSHVCSHLMNDNILLSIPFVIPHSSICLLNRLVNVGKLSPSLNFGGFSALTEFLVGPLLLKCWSSAGLEWLLSYILSDLLSSLSNVLLLCLLNSSPTGRRNSVSSLIAYLSSSLSTIRSSFAFVYSVLFSSRVTISISSALILFLNSSMFTKTLAHAVLLS